MSKDNTSEPSNGTTVAGSGVINVLLGSSAGCGPKFTSNSTALPEGAAGHNKPEVVNVIPTSNVGGGIKCLYDAITNLADPLDLYPAATEPGGSQVKRHEIGRLTFKGNGRLADVEDEVLVPIPKSLYGKLTGSTIDLNDSATEPESSSDYEANGHLNCKYLT